jgi:hypothetical protein
MGIIAALSLIEIEIHFQFDHGGTGARCGRRRTAM